MDDGEIIKQLLELVEQLRLEIELLTAKASEIEPLRQKSVSLKPG